MTEEQIKEALSGHYISTLAAYKGFKLQKPPSDTGGVDFQFSKDDIYYQNGQKEYLESGFHIDIQVKCTTLNTADETSNPGFVVYDLNAKAYNNLIRRQLRGGTPLVLVVFILPSANVEWVEADNMRLVLRHRAYWYYPDVAKGLTNNASSIRIQVPKANIFSLDTWETLYNKFSTR